MTKNNNEVCPDQVLFTLRNKYKYLLNFLACHHQFLLPEGQYPDYKSKTIQLRMSHQQTVITSKTIDRCHLSSMLGVIQTWIILTNYKRIQNISSAILIQVIIPCILSIHPYLAQEIILVRKWTKCIISS